MRLTALELEGFRNYARERIAFDARCNVIVGDNAQGKTNLLEAVVCLSGVRSPRARTERELIGFEAPAARLAGDVFSREREFHIEVALSREHRRKLTVNGVPARGSASAALSGVLNTVLFRPEDLDLIRAGAAVRRRFLDTALCQLRPRYAAALSAYRRAWEQKTRILRDAREYPGLLPALPEFSEQMVRYGAVLVRYRARFLQRLGENAAAQHRECSGEREQMELRYLTAGIRNHPEGESSPERRNHPEGENSPEKRNQPEGENDSERKIDSEKEEGIPGEEEIASILRRHMEAHREAEAQARQCLSGPHRDDFLVTINAREARTFASQGQARTAALALKMAERELYRNASGEYPVFLLDDVLSELDPRRQEFVLNRIGEGQVLITCCEEDRLSGLLDGRVLRIRGGRLVEK